VTAWLLEDKTSSHAFLEREDHDDRRHGEHQHDADSRGGNRAVIKRDQDEQYFDQNQEQHGITADLVADGETDFRRGVAAVGGPAQHFEAVFEKRRPDNEIEHPSQRDHQHHDVRYRNGDDGRQRRRMKRVRHDLRPTLAQRR